jgi:tetratricopeptide (TPR) repeat protein
MRCRSDLEAAYESFLHAATVDGPAQAAAFAYLGHHFRAIKREEMKARKCYRRALEINPREASAGAALCELLHESNSEDIVGDVCREILATAPNAEWAQRRLGVHNLHIGRPTEAISCLQVPFCINSSLIATITPCLISSAFVACILCLEPINFESTSCRDPVDGSSGGEASRGSRFQHVCICCPYEASSCLWVQQALACRCS